MSGGRHVEFCPKTLRGQTKSVPLVGGGRREGRKFARGWIGSGPFWNLEKSRSPLYVVMSVRAVVAEDGRGRDGSRPTGGDAVDGGHRRPHRPRWDHYHADWGQHWSNSHRN